MNLLVRESPRRVPPPIVLELFDGFHIGDLASVCATPQFALRSEGSSPKGFTPLWESGSTATGFFADGTYASVCLETLSTRERFRSFFQVASALLVDLWHEGVGGDLLRAEAARFDDPHTNELLLEIDGRPRAVDESEEAYFSWRKRLLARMS